jgi:hypothetical protein
VPVNVPVSGFGAGGGHAGLDSVGDAGIDAGGDAGFDAVLGHGNVREVAARRDRVFSNLPNGFADDGVERME